MNEKEKQLFKALCRFREPLPDGTLIDAATPDVLGLLFFNRMQGVAYGALKRSGLLGHVNREFRNSLGAAYEQNVRKNQSLRECIASLSALLAPCPCRVAMLKGAYLCYHYPEGYRTANDVDLLVSPRDVTVIGNLLTAAGFRQGYVREGVLIPATRQEIISSRMMRGETVPYIKEVKLPFLRFFEVDINYSLDYKNDDGDALARMLSDACERNEGGLSLPTLSETDFFLHLCAHLYKEATTLPWIEMRRDMTLFKYCDIYLLLSEMTDEKFERVFCRAKALGMEKICAYAVLEAMGLFDMDRPTARRAAERALADDPDFCLRVISPKERKTLLYQTPDVNERFFMEARIRDLKEVE